jgi:hypothetical protein
MSINVSWLRKYVFVHELYAFCRPIVPAAALAFFTFALNREAILSIVSSRSPGAAGVMLT